MSIYVCVCVCVFMRMKSHIMFMFIYDRELVNTWKTIDRRFDIQHTIVLQARKSNINYKPHTKSNSKSTSNTKELKTEHIRFSHMLRLFVLALELLYLYTYASVIIKCCGECVSAVLWYVANIKMIFIVVTITSTPKIMKILIMRYRWKYSQITSSNILNVWSASQATHWT